MTSGYGSSKSVSARGDRAGGEVRAGDEGRARPDVVAGQGGCLAVGLAGGRQAEVGVGFADLGRLFRNAGRGGAPVDVEVTPVFLRDRKDRGEGFGAFEVDEGVERQVGADQAEFAVGAFELGGGRRDVGGGQGSQAGETSRMGAHELGEVVVVGPPERPGLVGREHAVVGETGVADDLALDADGVEVGEALGGVIPDGCLGFGVGTRFGFAFAELEALALGVDHVTRADGALGEELGHAGADPVGVPVDDRTARDVHGACCGWRGGRAGRWDCGGEQGRKRGGGGEAGGGGEEESAAFHASGAAGVDQTAMPLALSSARVLST